MVVCVCVFVMVAQQLLGGHGSQQLVQWCVYTLLAMNVCVCVCVCVCDMVANST